MICPICGDEMDYIGVDDSGGDYGSALCEEYCCPMCDHCEEVNCEELLDDDDDTAEFDPSEFYDEPIDPPF